MDNNTLNVYISGSSGNTFLSPTKLGYWYGGSTTNFKSYMGNYYSDYTGNHSDNNGIGDTAYGKNGVTDNYPLKQSLDNYSLQTWWLADLMYRGDMSQSGGPVDHRRGFLPDMGS